MTNLQGSDLLKLLIAVDELEVQTLIHCIQEYLIKHQSEFLQQNSVEILKIIYQHNSFTELWNYYLEKICKDPKSFFDSNEFVSLSAPLLESILKRDDLGLEEIFIWEKDIRFVR